MNTAVWIVALVMVAVVLKTWLRTRSLGCSDDLRQQTKAQETEIRSLRERVEALEAIVTDKAYHLRRDIDDLKH